MFKKVIIFIGILCSISFLSNAKELDKPSVQEATVAIGTMMGLPQELLNSATVRLGTCIPAINASHKGQIACTVAFIVGAGSSETQVDFHRDSKQATLWVAEPSTSQDKLPFPDPKLQ